MMDAIVELGEEPPAAPPILFKDCLRFVPVPGGILTGVRVSRVNGDGKKKAAYLTLSDDQFTIFVTKNRFKKERVGYSNRISTLLTQANVAIDEKLEDALVIDVGCIVRIQKGQSTLKFELSQMKHCSTGFNCRKPIDIDSSKCFSIFCVGGRSIGLMIDDIGSNRDEIVDALERLTCAYAKKKERVGGSVLLLRYIWYDSDKDNSGTIDSKELAKIFRRINYEIKKSECDRLYDEVTKGTRFKRNASILGRRNRQMGLTFEQCATIVHRVRCDSSKGVRPVIQILVDLFGEQMRNGEVLEMVSAESFLRKFMLTKQGETNMTIELVRQIFSKLNQIEILDVASNLSVEDSMVEISIGFEHIDSNRFETYLMSKENDIFDPAKEEFDQSLMKSRPLSDFWINSSHNTYLTGDQLLSFSSAEMYTHALHQGCRCLELDCWDGQGVSKLAITPVIYHGYTLTSKITFHAVIEAVKVFLDEHPNCYPIILSLENHCSIPFQEAMANCMTRIFKDSLYIPSEESLDDPIPSADILKGKVILKGKRITSSGEDSVDSDSCSDSDSDLDDSEVVCSKKPKSKGPKVKICPKLSALTYFHSHHMKSFKESEDDPPNHMHSFGESKVNKLSRKKDLRAGWMSFNRSHMTRTYPAGSRTDSSNYNPIPAWSVGSQLVALNLQISDSARRLNDGRFRENGGCGYVLKPNSINMVDASPPQPITLYVKVLCGTCLPKHNGKKTGERIDPYVNVCLFDVANNTGKVLKISHHTQPIQNNGFNPVWIQKEAFKYDVHNPDVAMLQLTVLHNEVGLGVGLGLGDEFIASSSVPVSCIRQGYRSVKLFDEKNMRSGPFDFASLLIEVRITPL